MKITLEEVRQTAQLARLRLDDDEAQRAQRELDAILRYMETLSSVDVSGVAPMTHAVEMAMPLRADELGPTLDVEAALAAAPRRDGPYFEVPRVIKAGPHGTGAPVAERDEGSG